MVLAGSNDITPLLQPKTINEEPLKDTTQTNEPLESTQKNDGEDNDPSFFKNYLS